MKKNLIVPALGIVSLIIAGSFLLPETGVKNELIVRTSMQGLSMLHYTPLKTDDTLSARVFNMYIDRLDGSKRFFIRQDIEAFKKYQYKIDDEIGAATFTFFNLTVETLNKRIAEAEKYYKYFLSSPMTFDKEEMHETDPDKTTYAPDTTALKEYWRKQLKYQVMLNLSSLLDKQEKAQTDKDTSVKIKTFSELEAEARATVLKNYDDYYRRMGQLETNDRFATYINCIANSHDPHTEFFPPADKANFDIGLTGRLEGIGATLQEREGYIRVASLVPGGPAWKQGELKVGDQILKVAQGDKEPVDIVGWRVDKAVQLIRGKKGTEVRLTIKKADGTMPVIIITRDVVIIEDTYAKSAVIKGQKTIGYIRLPVFYSDFNKDGGRTCSDDVEKELEKLKKENVDGVIIDLRDNGGGSLMDVVEMAGLFFEKGPVVQVKGRNNSIEVLEDKNPSVVYDGPLVVMVNTVSASASEIFAAAIQDYKRGLIIGGDHTYGKGTVQRMINLDDMVPQEYANQKPLGNLKLTVQKFYRINGTTNQLKGVIPDIILPDNFSSYDLGEKELEFPMKWDEIKPAKYTVWSKPADIKKAVEASRNRTASDSLFQLELQNSKRLKQLSDKTQYTLHLEKFRKEMKQREEEAKRFEKIEKTSAPFSITHSKADLPAVQSDSSRAIRDSVWISNLKKDIYLHEAVSVVKELW